MIPRPKGRQPIPEHAKKVFTGELFEVYQWEQEMFDGSVATFEKLKRDDTVTVIPVLPNGNILIIDDEQPGRTSAPTFPGGRLDGDEHPETGARRELLEETGYAPGEMVFLRSQQPVTKLDWAWYSFIARNCTKVTEPHLDVGERITVREVTFEELLDLVDEDAFQCQDMRHEFVRAKYNEDARNKLRALFLGP